MLSCPKSEASHCKEFALHISSVCCNARRYLGVVAACVVLTAPAAPDPASRVELIPLSSFCIVLSSSASHAALASLPLRRARTYKRLLRCFRKLVRFQLSADTSCLTVCVFSNIVLRVWNPDCSSFDFHND
jgi:hypothetical protein